MRRRLFNLAAAVSLILGAATVVLCVRSKYYYDRWVMPSVSPYAAVQSFDGELRVGYVSARRGALRLAFTSDAVMGFSFELNGVQQISESTHRPITSSFSFAGQAGTGLTVGVPQWLLLLVFLILPALRVYSWRRECAGPPFTCKTCGYDLRATPERCPECGTAVVTAPAGAAPGD
jgi:hypothetical protein